MTFHSGSLAGLTALFVNTTLSERVVRSSPALINITTSAVPTLASVTINSSATSVALGGSLTLSATVNCTGGMCLSGVTYVWTISNSLGALNQTTGPSVTFTAGSSAGSVVVSVSASLNGISKDGSTTVTITQVIGPKGPSTFLGFSGNTGYYILAAILIALAVAVGLIVWGVRRRKREERRPPPQPFTTSPTSSEPSAIQSPPGLPR